MNGKSIEDYCNIEIIPEDSTNPEIIFSNDEEISELKDILIFEEKENESK